MPTIRLDLLVFTCSVCHRTFNSKDGHKGLDQHFARFHELRNVENCPYCGKQFSRLKVHVPISSANPIKRKLYQCPTCLITYQKKNTFEEHIKKKCKTVT